MHAFRFSNVIVLALFVLSLLGILPAPAVQATEPRTPCSCVTLIKNRFNLSQTANAKDMGAILTSRQHRFVRLSGPRVGAVVIIQPAALAALGGDPARFGHIAVIESFTVSGNSVRLRLRGANQGPASQWSRPVAPEHGCSNVFVTDYAPIDARHLSYFGR